MKVSGKIQPKRKGWFFLGLKCDTDTITRMNPEKSEWKAGEGWMADKPVLENSAFRAEFCPDTGAVLQLRDKVRKFNHLLPRKKPAPFRLERGGRMHRAFQDFQWQAAGDALKFTWILPGAVLRAQVHLLEDGLSFASELTGPGAARYRAVEYPILDGLASSGEDSYLAHAYATGVLFRNPASILPSRGGLRFCPYPESFSGASMQLMAYYHQNRSGLYLAAHDGQACQKWLNAYALHGRLSLSHMHGFEHLGSPEGIRQPYPFVVLLYDGAGWETAAEMYRQFALAQPWSAGGPLWQRESEGDWLRGDMGYCTFGINAGHDRSQWVHQYARDIQVPGFHVLGPDWTNRPQTFGSGIPGGLEDWLPTRFHPATLGAIRVHGHRFAPFEFDFLVSLNQSDQETLRENLQAFPQPPFSHDGYRFNMLCPCQPFTQTFHRERDTQVQEESGCDALYYDISANNLIKICLREDHQHHPGGGREITEGYRACYRQTARAMSERAGRRILLGTEMMCEVFLGELDFYQARAWGQPSSTLETWPFRAQMLSGQARMIPMFDHVYHDYGPVRMDGWGKLVEETGSLFYFNLAKVYLWGGLYEINHEYSPMEALDGRENPGEEHYFRFEPQGYAYAPKRAAYLAQFAGARVGLAKPYWAYGRLLAAPKAAFPKAAYTWFHYNHDKGNPSYKAGGVYEESAVMLSLYESPEGDLALFLANCTMEDCTFNPGEITLPRVPPDAPGSWVQFSGTHSPYIQDFRMDGGARPLLPLTLYMLEIKQKERGTLH